MVSTQTRASDATHLYELLVEAVRHAPCDCPARWHEAAIQALRVALHALALLPDAGQLATHGPTVEALRDYLGHPADVATTVGVVDHATHRLAFAAGKTPDDQERLRVLRLFLSHYRGSMQRERG